MHIELQKSVEKRNGPSKWIIWEPVNESVEIATDWNTPGQWRFTDQHKANYKKWVSETEQIFRYFENT